VIVSAKLLGDHSCLHRYPFDERISSE